MLDFVAAPSTSLVDAARTAAPAAELLPIARSRSTGGIVSTLDWVRIAVLSARGGLSGRGSRRAPLSLTLRLSSVPRGQSTSRRVADVRGAAGWCAAPSGLGSGPSAYGYGATCVRSCAGGVVGPRWRRAAPGAGVKHLTIIIIAPCHLSCADTGPRAPTSVERTSTVWLQVGLGARVYEVYGTRGARNKLRGDSRSLRPKQVTRQGSAHTRVEGARTRVPTRHPIALGG